MWPKCFVGWCHVFIVRGVPSRMLLTALHGQASVGADQVADEVLEDGVSNGWRWSGRHLLDLVMPHFTSVSNGLSLQTRSPNDMH